MPECCADTETAYVRAIAANKTRVLGTQARIYTQAMAAVHSSLIEFQHTL